MAVDEGDGLRERVQDELGREEGERQCDSARDGGAAGCCVPLEAERDADVGEVLEDHKVVLVEAVELLQPGVAEDVAPEERDGACKRPQLRVRAEGRTCS